MCVATRGNRNSFHFHFLSISIGIQVEWKQISAQELHTLILCQRVSQRRCITYFLRQIVFEICHRQMAPDIKQFVVKVRFRKCLRPFRDRRQCAARNVPNTP